MRLLTLMPPGPLEGKGGRLKRFYMGVRTWRRGGAEELQREWRGAVKRRTHGEAFYERGDRRETGWRRN